jgi:large subunit ribosomal protein L16
MGKGKGNVDFWFCHVKPGRILFEIAVSRRKIAVLKSTFRFALIKLPVKAQIITRNLTN